MRAEVLEGPRPQTIVQSQRIRFFECARLVPMVHLDSLDHPETRGTSARRAVHERRLILRLRHGGNETLDEVRRRTLYVERHVLETKPGGLRGGLLLVDVSA